MKLSELKTENETIDILHPEYGDVGIQFVVCSPMSREFTVNSSRLVQSSTDDEPLASWIVNQAIAAVVGWSGIEDENGEQIPFTEEECEKLLKDPCYFWMASCVDAHLGKKKGYFQMLTSKLKSS